MQLKMTRNEINTSQVDFICVRQRNFSQMRNCSKNADKLKIYGINTKHSLQLSLCAFFFNSQHYTFYQLFCLSLFSTFVHPLTNKRLAHASQKALNSIRAGFFFTHRYYTFAFV